MKFFTTLSLLFLLPSLLLSQEVMKKDDYTFTLEQQQLCTEVKNQQRTGTCWSFSTVSFLESEMMRQGRPAVDLSDMFAVWHTYMDKARRYVRYHGKANFSEGSLAHDVMNVLQRHGMAPEAAYDGLPEGGKGYDHSRLVKELSAYLDELIQSPPLPPDWEEKVAAILNEQLGAIPETFTYEGRTYTPRTFADEVVGINPEDYLSLTSFTHHPWYSSFILEVPDNYSDGYFYNLPLDELMEVTNHALENGFTIEWDGDVSEKGFSAANGLAILPDEAWSEMEEGERKNAFSKPLPQEEVSQQERQEAFDRYLLTDDHLMHVVGKAKEENGDIYYLIKNSWGARGLGFEGYLFASEAYYRMNTISILVHWEAVPKNIVDKLKQK